MTTNTKELLQEAVASAQANLQIAAAELQAYIDSVDNNVFDNMEHAERVLENRLLGYANEACEGSYNCGMDEYAQEFIVDGLHYLATLTCAYNRHDGQFHYVEESEFSVAPLYAAVF